MTIHIWTVSTYSNIVAKPRSQTHTFSNGSFEGGSKACLEYFDAWRLLFGNALIVLPMILRGEVSRSSGFEKELLRFRARLERGDVDVLLVTRRLLRPMVFREGIRLGDLLLDNMLVFTEQARYVGRR